MAPFMEIYKLCQRYHLVLVTGNGLVVVDVDDPALLGDVIAHCGDTPQKSRTPSGGFHLWYGMRKGVRYGGAVKIKISGTGKLLRRKGSVNNYRRKKHNRSKGLFDEMIEVHPSVKKRLMKLLPYGS